MSTIKMNPEEIYIHKDEYSDIEYKISHILSKLEQKVLILYLYGKYYQAIAVYLNRNVKSIDNAL